ncbi:hypothetical protein ACN38_g10546 [Penicillium nordicum]|uniref:Uncharacterized protein n=1 Tax=Penicillium nordicum TaxID=229535 RepID=A0A0N0RXT8_9EURO|nr:hypothetical protein ACN38_g10546 [Penicillium nordicum]
MFWGLNCFLSKVHRLQLASLGCYSVHYSFLLGMSISIPPTLLTAQAYLNYAYVINHVVKHRSFLSNHVQPNHDLFITRRLGTQHPQSPLL